ncbi:hypothetical protein KNP414_07294 [Paenibacillus mucilaginosus KNP414]|uniref:Uncharacterized protein n=1 Tax=Paenibacillus mucilaginosus (strain KNP414) TaxID=1036673 RepID=F8FP25_PAEMK|nr:hypothetical protein KNP414_07294 [Paenibacillus mucilaginosus KNP414]
MRSQKRIPFLLQPERFLTPAGITALAAGPLFPGVRSVMYRSYHYSEKDKHM